jgi:hypothetical protein
MQLAHVGHKAATPHVAKCSAQYVHRYTGMPQRLRYGISE